MRYRCENRRCNWIGADTELLRAPSPFDGSETLIACPRCKDIGAARGLCDRDGCNHYATCGTPTADGYRSTCYDHAPMPALPAAEPER